MADLLARDQRLVPDFRKISIRSLAQYYRGGLSAALAVNVAYRGEVAIWVLGSIIQPMVLIPVWQAAAGPSGSISGYSPGLFVTYFALQTFVSHITFIWLMWEFEWRVREGMFSSLLVLPIHPIHNDVCQNVAYKLIGLIGIVPALVVIMTVFGGDLSGITAVGILLFIPSVLLAAVLRFILEWVLSTAAFWITKTNALNNLYFSVGLFLGGTFAPLAVLPGIVQSVAFVAPFSWTVAFPIDVVMGKRDGGAIAVGFGMQVVWIGLAVLLLKVVWKRAVRRYSAVGS